MLIKPFVCLFSDVPVAVAVAVAVVVFLNFMLNSHWIKLFEFLSLFRRQMYFVKYEKDELMN